MMYRLCEWEENGYHDSDGYLAFYNSETNTIGRKLIWSTRCAGFEGNYLLDFPMPTLQIVYQAIAVLASFIFENLKNAAYREIFEPEQFRRGDQVVFLTDAKGRGKKIKVPAGARGTVFWTGYFGTFYAKGYNHPGRDNGRVGVELTDGSKEYVNMSCLGLDKPMPTDEELMEKANAIAKECQFRSMYFGGWDSKNWALEVLAEAKNNSQQTNVA